MLEWTNVHRRALRASSVSLLLAVLPASVGAGSQPAESKKTSKPSGKMSDFFEKYKDEYTATEEPRFVDLDPAAYLAISGRSEPGSELFRKKMEALYSVANAIHTRYTAAGRRYTNGPLESLWWKPKKQHEDTDEPEETWHWRLLIRTPKFIGNRAVAEAVARLSEQDADTLAKEVSLKALQEGRCVQALHIGPYDKATETLDAMEAFAKEHGLKPYDVRHEVYLSDPNREPPEKLRTILRLSVN
jgi:hypothetical protein